MPGWRNGRREGLKIPYPEKDVWVQFPPPVPIIPYTVCTMKTLSLTLFFLLTILALQACSSAPVTNTEENSSLSASAEYLSGGDTGGSPENDSSMTVTNYGQINTTAWKLYHNKNMGFEIEYPPTFSVEETPDKITIKSISETTSDQIVFTSVKSTLRDLVADVVYHAYRIDRNGFWMLDKNVMFAIARYQSGDAGSWFMTYFLMRDADFPENILEGVPKEKPYQVIVAQVDAFPSEKEMADMQRLASEGLITIDSVLSIPQQILATFRFTETP